MIRLEQVSKHYRRGGEVVRALDAVSLEIPQGAFAVLTGPSGSGKTTLIHLVSGLMRPTAGSVRVGDARLETLSPAQCARLRAASIAVVFQMFHLVPYLTALENVLLPSLARLAADKRETVARAGQLLDNLGMTHRAGHRPDQLSVGERQRCALARALLNRPSIILADEPTGNLDPESAGKVIAALAAAHREGATILLATHQTLDGVQSDVAYQLREGKLLAS